MNREIEDYTYYDLSLYLCASSCKRLARANPGVSYIERELHKIESYSKFIPLYPDVKCENLEFFYFNLRAVCVLNPLLADDFLKLGWRGLIWCCWLSLISPYDKSFLVKRIEKYIGLDKDIDWLVKLAIQSSQGQAPEHRLYDLAVRFRRHLNNAPFMFIPLRRFPNAKEQSEFYSRADKIKEIYKTQGAHKAYRFIKSNEKYEWELPYSTWLKRKQNQLTKGSK